MTFEHYLDMVNQNVFLKEFTFHNTKFRPTATEEVELADYVVMLSDVLVIFQAKERDPSRKTHDMRIELSWLRNSVTKKATRQIRNSVQYLQDHSRILANNNRGHEFPITADNRALVRVVVFDNDALSGSHEVPRFHNSSTVGLIHIFSKEEYVLVVYTLFTPAEINEYLVFRENLLLKHFRDNRPPVERVILGQYLSGQLASVPNPQFEEYLERMEGETSDFDLSHILTQFGDKAFSYKNGSSETEYYSILEQFSKLTRSTLGLIKERVRYCLEKIRSESQALPTRIYDPQTECGFVLMPVLKDGVPTRLNYLQNITAAAKYDGRMPKQIGICFSLDNDEVLIDWCYIEGRFSYNAEMEKALKAHSPFKEVKSEVISRYKFST